MILSLDVDGCLLIPGTAAFSPGAVAFVRAMLARGCRVILHATARSRPDDLARVLAMFDAAGLPAPVVLDPDEPSKARAIAAWLLDEYAGDWPPVVIVDDDPIDAPWATVIRCDPRAGVGEKDLARVPAGR